MSTEPTSPEAGPAAGPTTAAGPAATAALGALLLLTDGRLPSGAHAHSGGVEAAVATGRVTDTGSLHAFLLGRLTTTGLTTAALAAAACAEVDPRELDAAADARTPAPTARAVSRRLGRQLLRAARAAWPHPALDQLAAAWPRGPHQSVVLGTTARAAGLDPHHAALAAAHDTVTGSATAAVRLLGLDPIAVSAVQARLAGQVDAVAARAAEAAHRARVHGPDVLPAHSAPLLDLLAEDHATWEVRLFAS
ncbi:urease accessory protein UreF [Allostreptomyces psammosilenae]|uniref:Urease accessory protein UreF n=1 Tax=Allostreptomyces psammosilenae TaxID=1892865 RepID=A0A852ZUK6_9ACTN|nr:urease accessory UreF family protein [Allostreptomyces psammosilenae]NYI04454.1 urease accessory protein [Allostreptomyces psammosilenae]